MSKKELNKNLEKRVKFIYSLLYEVEQKSYEDWIEGFALDHFPAREIYYFDILAHAFAFYELAHNYHDFSKTKAYECIGGFLLGRDIDYLSSKYKDYFSKDDVTEMKTYFDAASTAVHRYYR